MQVENNRRAGEGILKLDKIDIKPKAFKRIK